MDNNFDLNNLKEQLDTQDVSDMFTQEDIAQNKLFAALAAIPLLFWLPIVARPESGFGKFYANQGLILTILDVVLTIITVVLGGVLGIIPLIGKLLAGIVRLAVVLCVLAACLFLLVNALNGKAKELPLVGSLMTVFK